MPDGRPDPVQINSWQRAEQNAAAWMLHWGHRDAVCTPASPDGGVAGFQ
jgi:hypothetical protein